MMDLAYLQKHRQNRPHFKAECANFVVKEQLGYDMSGDGEFVAVKVRKTDCNTLFRRSNWQNCRHFRAQT